MATPSLTQWLRVALCFGMIGAGQAFAQLATPVLYDDRGTISVVYENDWVDGGKDRNYTNGVRMSYVSGSTPTDGISEYIADKLLGAEKQSVLRWGGAIGHSIFTPNDIEATAYLPEQHPYAGWLYGEFTVMAANSGQIDQFTLQLGVVGPWAGGEWVQNEVHKLVGAPQARGWDNQIGNEVGLGLSYDRRYQARKLFAGRVLMADVIPAAGITLGNIHTNLRLGATVRIGQDLSNDYGPARVRPSLAGAGFFSPSDNFSWYWFAGLEGRAVVHNIFLDGSLLRSDDPELGSKDFVGDLQTGLVFQFGNTQMGLTFVERTKEFETQRSNHRFGAITLSRKF